MHLTDAPCIQPCLRMLLIHVIMHCSMDNMQTAAQRNAMLVHGLDWSERRAGIFEPAPSDEAAVATTLGLVLNCLSSGLYMVHCNFTSTAVLLWMCSTWLLNAMQQIGFLRRCTGSWCSMQSSLAHEPHAALVLL